MVNHVIFSKPHSRRFELKKTEEVIQKDYDAKKTEVLKEIESKKSSVLAEADQLSKSLLEKLTKSVNKMLKFLSLMIISGKIP